MSDCCVQGLVPAGRRHEERHQSITSLCCQLSTRYTRSRKRASPSRSYAGHAQVHVPQLRESSAATNALPVFEKSPILGTTDGLGSFENSFPSPVHQASQSRGYILSLAKTVFRLLEVGYQAPAELMDIYASVGGVRACSGRPLTLLSAHYKSPLPSSETNL